MHSAATAKTRGQARLKRQPKQPDKYDPAKQGRQTGVGHSLAMDAASRRARDAATLLKATSKQATKVKAAEKGPFTDAFTHKALLPCQLEDRGC